MDKNKKTMADYASQSLGDSTSYAIYTDQYDPALLVRMPRNLAREDWGIKGDEFTGYDVWHCHEATFLNYYGLPIAGTLKIMIPSHSRWMIESKSMKLFLNSFDMCRMGSSNIQNAIGDYERKVGYHLGQCIDHGVQVRFFLDRQEEYDVISGYHNLYDLVDVENLEITDYNCEENHLESIELKEGKQDDIYDVKVYTNVLRSRCRHTKQKDTGSAYIHIQCSKKTVELSGLLKHIISLREKNEFHEFCAEKLLVDISKVDGVKEVMVMLLYARRGSLDINPIRTTSGSLLPEHFVNIEELTTKTHGQ